jgi:hypothetical protein
MDANKEIAVLFCSSFCSYDRGTTFPDGPTTGVGVADDPLLCFKISFMNGVPEEHPVPMNIISDEVGSDG